MRYQPERKNVSWAWLQSDLSPFKEVAGQKRWREKYLNAMEKGGEAFEQFLIEQLNEHLEPSLLLDIQLWTQRHLDKSISEEYDIAWLTFIGYVEGYRKKAPDHPATGVLQFYLSQANQQMDIVETALWMLIAYYELTLVENGQPLGSGNQPELALALDDWTPETSKDGLISTRYRILGSQVFTENKNLDDNDRRVMNQQRGSRYLKKGDKWPKVVSVEAFYRRLDFESIGITNQTDPAVKQKYKEDLSGLVYFAAFFGLIQFQLLQSGVKPKCIVNRFAQHSAIKVEFYDKLLVDNKLSR